MTTRTLAIPTTAKGVGILEVTIGNVGTDFALGMVMNNVAVVDSRHPLSQAKKRILGMATAAKRTDDHIRDIRLCELVASCYWKQTSHLLPVEKVNPYQDNQVTLTFEGWADPMVPGMNLKSAIKSAAKMGRRGGDIDKAITVQDSMLVYEGPRSADELIADPDHDLRMTTCNGGKSSKVHKSRIKFNEWKITTKIFVDENILDPEQVVEYLSTTGRALGLNDARTLGFGRFEILEPPTYTN